MAPIFQKTFARQGHLEGYHLEEKATFHTGYTKPELWNPHKNPSGTLQEQSKRLKKEQEELRIKKQALSFAERIKIERKYHETVKKLWIYRIVTTFLAFIIYTIIHPFSDIGYKTVVFLWFLLPMIDAWIRDVREIDFYN